MKTQAYPYAEIAEGTYEIGEFDCASIFLLVGDERAMLIDTGVGIGDLKGFVRKLTDRPLMVCFTHNHVDHVGGASAFKEGYIHPRDMAGFTSGGGIGLSVEVRRRYVQFIAEREKGTYPYQLDVDLTPWGPPPTLHPLQDQQVIDLGGRRVVVYACPGHTAGSVTFLDEGSRSLFVGDACNCNLLLWLGSPERDPSLTPVETALSHLQRLQDLGDRYDRMFNGHYDFRPLGQPLGPDVLPDAIAAVQQILAGTAEVTVERLPLPGAPEPHMVQVGRTRVSFDPAHIRA